MQNLIAAGGALAFLLLVCAALLHGGMRSRGVTDQPTELCAVIRAGQPTRGCVREGSLLPAVYPRSPTLSTNLAAALLYDGCEPTS